MFIFSIIAFIFSVIGFMLNSRKNILCWPFWFVSGCIFAYIYFSNKLYIGCLREVVYVILGFDGYYRWRYKNGQRK